MKHKINLKNLIIKTFLVLILSIINSCNTKPKSTYDEKTQTTRYEKPLTPALEIPFDITKKGNQIELKLKIKEDREWSFRLGFYFDDPTMSKYYIVNFTRWFFGINPLRKMSQEELDEALKDEKRVRKLVGYKFNETYHPGIPTPIHLIITKIADDGSKQVLFDEIRDKWEGQNFSSCGVLTCDKELERMVLKKGNYKIFIKAIKNSPELVGNKICFYIGGRSKY